MNIFRRLAAVRAAHLRVIAARYELEGAAHPLLARGVAHPLTTVGVAASAGLVLGSLNLRPLRIPGLASLLGGGLAGTGAFAVRLLTDLGIAGIGAQDGRTADRPNDTGTGAPADSNAP
ncbi:MAG: hypothetical protein ABIU96_12925 [Rhodanobacter sp.]